MSQSNERLYYDTLKRIAKKYMTTEQLQRCAEEKYGVPYHEVLEMSYDNIQTAAAEAIRGKRRPVVKAKAHAQSEQAVAKDAANPEVVDKRGGAGEPSGERD